MQRRQQEPERQPRPPGQVTVGLRGQAGPQTDADLLTASYEQLPRAFDAPEDDPIILLYQGTTIGMCATFLPGHGLHMSAVHPLGPPDECRSVHRFMSQVI